MAVRTTTFRAVGGFEERFDRLGEDVAFGRALRAAGLTPVLRTDVLVARAGHPETTSARTLRARGAAMAHYLAAHHPAGTARLIRGCLAAGALVRAGANLAAADRERAAEHVGYLTGVVSGRTVERAVMISA
jgi:N-acetylglucosaminyl-diphospho-decaprenol L-rhamnosyltransferase